MPDDLYRAMLRIRMVEEEIAKRYDEQEMRCPVHLSIGQEAVAVGVCAALRPDDLIVSTHRCHAHYLAKGGNLQRMIAELYGKAAGCCGGRGGSMHLFDDEAGVLCSIPIVASAVPIGVGAALAIKNTPGDDRIVVIFCGDAVVEQGVFHEAVMFARLKNLPVVFVIENNLYSVYSLINDRQTWQLIYQINFVASRIEPDAIKIYKDMKRWIAKVRETNKPPIIVFRTYRFHEHVGPKQDFSDRMGAVEAIVNDWEYGKSRDIVMVSEIQKEIDEAFEFAKEAPFP